MIRKIKKEQKQTNKKLNFIIDLLTNKKELSITHFSIDIPYLVTPTISHKELFSYFDFDNKPQSKLNKSANESKLKIEDFLNSSNSSSTNKKIDLEQFKIEPKIEVMNINKELSKVTKINNNDTSSEASIARIFCVSENRSQINSSHSEISSLQSSSSNEANSTQERFKKVRGFNFKNNIKTKRIKDIDKQLSKEEFFDLQKFFLKPKQN